MAPTRITINGREYASPEEIPPELRRAYEEALGRLGSVTADRDGNGVPDVVEGKSPKELQRGVVVDSQIIVNSQSYRNAEEMPEEVRRLYKEAMSRAQRGPGVSVTKQGLHITFQQTHSGPGTSIDVPAAPRATEPAGILIRLHTAIVLAAGVAIAVLLIWALWR